MPNPVVALRIPPDLHRRITERAKAEGVTASELMRDTLTRAFPAESDVGPALRSANVKLRPPVRRG